MAQITLKDILGTDNISASRPIINKNMQTIANFLNTLHEYLDTDAPGGTLTVGTITTKLGQNTTNTVLVKNEGSGEIDGNLHIKQNVTILGDTETASINIDDEVMIDNSDLKIGVGTGINLKHINGMHIAQNMIIPESNYKAAHSSASGIVDVNVEGERKIVLDYSLLPDTPSNDTANAIRLTGNPVLGQLLYITIGNISTDYATQNIPIYIEGDNFHSKYGMGPVTLYNTANPSINAAVGFTGESEEEFMRQWVELIYNGNTWEVYNAHPGILGL